MGKCRRKLKDGEYFNSSNNRYEYHYTDRLGKKRVITSARLEPNDPLPKSKRGGKSLREKEAEILKLLQNNHEGEIQRFSNANGLVFNQTDV